MKYWASIVAAAAVIALGAPAAFGAGASTTGSTQAGKRVSTTQTLSAINVTPVGMLVKLPQWV